MQRLKFLILLFSVIILASALYFVSYQVQLRVPLIKEVTGTEEKYFYQIHSWQERAGRNLHYWLQSYTSCEYRQSSLLAPQLLESSEGDKETESISLRKYLAAKSGARRNGPAVFADFVPVASTVKLKRIIYNRVGKCGSRTMVQLMVTLAKQNKFKVIGSTRNQLLRIGLREQVEFVDFIDQLQAPFIYHHHLHYVDFKRFGSLQPIYINLIRDPLARLVSGYYFRRFGDYREGHRTWNFKGTDKEKNQTFDECVLNNMTECVHPAKIFYIVPFFCGQESYCRNPSEVAVRQAKINVIRNYLLVGVTEELEDFLFALEALLPEFFKGVLNVYKAPGEALQDKITTTKTLNKKGPSATVEKIMMKKLELEYDFYNFVKARFRKIKAELKSASS